MNYRVNTGWSYKLEINKRKRRIIENRNLVRNMFCCFTRALATIIHPVAGQLVYQVKYSSLRCFVPKVYKPVNKNNVVVKLYDWCNKQPNVPFLSVLCYTGCIIRLKPCYFQELGTQYPNLHVVNLEITDYDSYPAVVKQVFLNSLTSLIIGQIDYLQVDL